MSVLGVVVVLGVTSYFDVVGFAIAGLIPHDHRPRHPDRPPVDRHVQLHPRRVAARSARRPRPHQPDQPVDPRSTGSRASGWSSRCSGGPSAGTRSTSTSSATATASDEDGDSSGATSVLLPVADADQIRLALGRILPGVDVDRVELHPSPPQARWVRWYDFWTLRYGYDDRVLVAEHGWLIHVRNIVPHAKTQSVRIEQGPLQRRLGLADVHLDLTRGPVSAVAHQIDVGAARALGLSQLDRAKVARAADLERRAADPRRLRRAQGTRRCLLGLGSTRRRSSAPAASRRCTRSTSSGCCGSTGRPTKRRPQLTEQLRRFYDLWAYSARPASSRSRCRRSWRPGGSATASSPSTGASPDAACPVGWPEPSLTAPRGPARLPRRRCRTAAASDPDAALRPADRGRSARVQQSRGPAHRPDDRGPEPQTGTGWSRTCPA